MPETRHSAALRWLLAATMTGIPMIALAQVSVPGDRTDISALTLAEVDDYIELYFTKMKVVSTARDLGGRAVDCVDTATQPAMHNPLLAGHRIQLSPSPQLKRLLPGPVTAGTTEPLCPAGAVPVRTPTRAEVLRAGSLRNFQRKFRPLPGDSTARSGGAPPAIYAHEYAAVGANVNNIAAQSTFNLWKPATDNGSEFSLTQFWIVGGTGANTQTIEIGSQVYPDKYGDTLPHLFIYYTADYYSTTGCYNLECGAFVQTSPSLVIGGPLPYSTPGGAQAEGTVAFYRDPATANWLLFHVSAGAYTQIGYYPSAIFGSGQLASHAQRIDFGGEVYLAPSTTHSGTDMGSGAFASAGYQQAAYQRNLLYMDLAGNIQHYSLAWFNQTNPNCYSVSYAGNSSWGNYIYFGGPGRGAGCP